MPEPTDAFLADGVFHEAVVEDDGVIKNVLLCGNASRNGRKIPPTAFGDAVALYEGVPVFMDHEYDPEKMANRGVRELAGVVHNVRMKDGKPYGDIDTKDYKEGEYLLKLARKPQGHKTRIGFSHTAAYKFKDKARTDVERVERVFSVDCVLNPATTNTFHEQEELPVADSTATDLLQGQVKTLQEQLDAAKAQMVQMEAEHKEALKALEVSLETVTSERDAALQQVDKYETEKAVADRKAAVLVELEAAGLDPNDKTQCSDIFLSQLHRESDEAARKVLINDRKAVVGDIAPKGRTLSRERTEKNVTNTEEFSAENVLSKFSPSEMFRD